VANAVSDGLDEVSSERTIHLELLLKEMKYFSAELNQARHTSTSGSQKLNNLDNSVCSTAAKQHATDKTCDPRAKSMIICFGVFRQ
jgi:hypothetical protein